MRVSLINWIKENGHIVIIASLLFLVGFLYSHEPGDSFGDHRSELNLEEATYLHVIYIGSSGCSYSNNEITHQLVKDLKNQLQNAAHESGYRFLSTGIAIDYSAYTGIDFLQNSGPYDEVISGNSWVGLGMYEYIWDTFPGEELTPQLLISKTKITPSLGYYNKEQQILERFYGTQELEELHSFLTSESSEEFQNRFRL